MAFPDCRHHDRVDCHSKSRGCLLKVLVFSLEQSGMLSSKRPTQQQVVSGHVGLLSHKADFTPAGSPQAQCCRWTLTQIANVELCMYILLPTCVYSCMMFRAFSAECNLRSCKSLYCSFVCSRMRLTTWTWVICSMLCCAGLKPGWLQVSYGYKGGGWGVHNTCIGRILFQIRPCRVVGTNSRTIYSMLAMCDLQHRVMFWAESACGQQIWSGWWRCVTFDRALLWDMSEQYRGLSPTVVH